MKNLEMCIAGFDSSVTSPSAVKFYLDSNYQVIKSDFIGFSKAKKHTDQKVIHLDPKLFKSTNEGIDRNIFLKKHLVDFFKDVDVYAMEGYAFGGVGKVFNLAEFAGMIKSELFERSVSLRIYTPMSIKKFAAKHGHADKITMKDAYEALKVSYKIDLGSYPEVVDGKKGASPTSDIIDAFFCCEILYQEILIRYGLKNLSELHPKAIEVFNSVDKKGSNNILSKEFISLVPNFLDK